MACPSKQRDASCGCCTGHTNSRRLRLHASHQSHLQLCGTNDAPLSTPHTHSVHSTWCPALLPPSQAVPLGDGDTFHNSLASFGEQLLLLTSHGEQICFLSVLWHQGMEKVFLVLPC